MGDGKVLNNLIDWEARGKRPLEWLRCMWEDKIKEEVREILMDRTNCIRLAEDRVQWRAFMNTIMTLRAP
jgi:hypothetical protein